VQQSEDFYFLPGVLHNNARLFQAGIAYFIATLSDGAI
jgi:hypothetical protein